MKLNDFRAALTKLLLNKYVIATSCFFVWLTLFDEDSLIERFNLSSQASELRKQRNQVSEEIANDRKKMDDLRNSRETLEKFAREEYLMKAPDEVVFVIK
ncbi:MAG: septum formation initiator family protein [Marinilabiliaceae bacterium]|nr:septum formation initiator family protein [Marinilabiliaceae bacterium]